MFGDNISTMAERATSRAVKWAMARELVEVIGYRKVCAGIQEIYNSTADARVERDCRYVMAKLAQDYCSEHGYIPEWFGLR